MAAYTLSSTGTNTVGTTVVVDASASGEAYVILNDSDAAVTVTLEEGTDVTVAEGLTHTVDAKSYKIVLVSEGGTGASTLAITDIKTAHGTSAQSSEIVYLAKVVA
jgi:hypothetical protein